MKKYIKLLSLVPLCIMLYIIFMFSAQDANESGSLSYKVCCFFVGIFNKLFFLKLSENRFAEIASSLQFFVRKCAHMTEYFILALTIFLPLRVLFRTDVPLFFNTTKSAADAPQNRETDDALQNPKSTANEQKKTVGIKNEKRTAWSACLTEKLWITLFFGVLCASLDEFHQTFVPGRAGLPTDVLIDSIGISTACLLLWFCHRTSFFRRITFGG